MPAALVVPPVPVRDISQRGVFAAVLQVRSEAQLDSVALRQHASSMFGRYPQ